MSASSDSPRPRLSSIDRSQLVFRTVDVERLIDDDHSARSIWEMIGRMDLSLYLAKIAAVEGHAGRDHTAPQLLISLWLYAYRRGISSAREIARRCEFEPAFQWLCGLQPISHRTLSGFRSENKDALGSVFVQVVGVLSAEGLITMERVTLDGTKIKANASGNTFRRKEKIEAHLAEAQTQLDKMNEQAAEEEKVAKRLASAQRRAARQRVSRLESALREVERLQQTTASTFKVHGKNSWKPIESDAQGQSGAFMSSAFPYDAKHDIYLCPAGQQLAHKTVLDRGHGVRTQVYKAPKAACASCVYRTQCASKKPKPERRGLRQFRCRGQEEAGLEATWACLSYNVIRLFSTRRKIANATVAAA